MPCSICKKTGHNKKTCTFLINNSKNVDRTEDILEDKNRNLLYGFAITFILVSLLFIVRAQRAKTRELLFKQTQQKANEEIFNLMMLQQSIIDESRYKEKKRMAQDLHDGVLGRMFGHLHIFYLFQIYYLLIFQFFP